MRLTIAVKDEHGKLYNLPDRYEFEPDHLTKLIDDFNTYCSTSTKQVHKRGGVYPCRVGSEKKLVFLKFDELVYIG